MVQWYLPGGAKVDRFSLFAQLMTVVIGHHCLRSSELLITIEFINNSHPPVYTTLRI